MVQLVRERVSGRADLVVAFTGLAAAACAAAALTLSAYSISPLAFPLALVALGFAVATVWRPALGVACAILVAPLEIFDLPILTGTVSPAEAALAFVGLAWAGRALAMPGSVVVPALRDLPILVLLGAVAAGTVTATDPAPVFRVLVLWTLYFFLYLQTQSFRVEEIRWIVIALAVSVGILGAMGAATYLQSGDLGLLAGGERTTERAAGTFVSPNNFASFLVIGLVPAIALVVADLRRYAWLLLPIALGIVGLAFSLSRGGMVAFVLSILVLLAWKRARKIALVVVLSFVVLTVTGVSPIVRWEPLEVVSERLGTLSRGQAFQTSQRPQIWATALDISAAHPFFGVGLNQFREQASRRGLFTRGRPLENAHSIPFSLAAETGIIGLAGFLFFVAQLGVRGVRAARPNDPLIYPLALGLMGALLGFLIQGLTIVQLRTPLLAGMFFALAGLLTALSDRRGEDADAPGALDIGRDDRRPRPAIGPAGRATAG